MDAEKAIKKAWEKLYAQIGTAAPIEGADLDKLENWVGKLPDIAVEEFAEDYLYDLEKFIRAIEIIDSIRRSMGNKSLKVKKTMGIKAAQIAKERFQRRVDIAEFVLFRVYDPIEFYGPLLMNVGTLPKRRINWKEMVKEWNQEHQSDIMTSTDVFRATFYRILREPDVFCGVIARNMERANDWWQQLESLVGKFRRWEESDGYQRALRELPADKVERYRKVVDGLYRLNEFR